MYARILVPIGDGVHEAERMAADLIVMGMHGHPSPASRGLGRDAALVLQASPVPVLLVRAADAGSTGR
jgi:nucleotide-binding universal stress UspA family protein